MHVSALDKLLRTFNEPDRIIGLVISCSNKSDISHHVTRMPKC